jgi:DNA replication protein DnaC
LAVSVIDHVCHAGKSARYIKALDLFREIRRAFVPVERGRSAESEADLVEQLAGYSLLVIDECHQRGETAWEQNTLVNLLDRRYDAMRATILVSNQTREEFSAAMGDSIVSRIHETGDAIVCEWGSFRRPGAWREVAQ